MKLSLILEAVDRMTRPARQAAAGVKELTDKAKPAAKAVEATARAVDKMTRPARQAAAGVKDLTDKAKQATKSVSDVDRQVTRVSADFIKWTRAALRTADALDRVADRGRALGRAGLLSVKWVGLKSIELGAIGAGKGLRFAAMRAKELVLWGARWGALGIAAGTGYLTAGMIGRNAGWEQLSVELERIEGSAARARAGLDWVRKLSWEAAAPLDDLAAAFVAARKAGLDPMSGSLQGLLDKSVETKRALEDIVQTVKEAKNFDFGGLESLGIDTDRKKGRVIFSWLDKEGKRASRSVRESSREIERALSDIFSAQSAGAAARQARTLGGMWQRLKNMVATFQLDVGDAGIFDLVKAKVQSLLNWVNEKAKDGSLRRWAAEVSDRLETMARRAEQFVSETDWKRVGEELHTIGRGAWGIALAFGRVVELVGKLDTGMRSLPQPPKWIGNADRSLRDWMFRPVWGPGAKEPSAPATPQHRPRPATPDVWMRGMTQRPRLAPPVARPGSTTRQPVKPAASQTPKGHIMLEIKPVHGVAVRPTKVAAKGMDLEVNTGRAMGGFA